MNFHSSVICISEFSRRLTWNFAQHQNNYINQNCNMSSEIDKMQTSLYIRVWNGFFTDLLVLALAV